MGWIAKLLALAVRWALSHPDTIKAGIDLLEKRSDQSAVARGPWGTGSGADGPKA